MGREPDSERGGQIQQIRFDGGGLCPTIAPIERDTDFLVQHGNKIASIAAFTRTEPVLVILDVPPTP